MQSNGLIINSKKVSVKLKAIICDAPVKAFICNVKCHTGYFGCTKCVCEGDYVDHRIIFNSLNSELRTNSSFRNRSQPEHHHGHSILEELDIDMVKTFPLDYMHLVLLGVTKIILLLW